MGCNIFNYLYIPDIKDKKYSLTIISNFETNESIPKNIVVNKEENSNKNAHPKNINISSNIYTIENPFPFVKIKPKNYSIK